VVLAARLLASRGLRGGGGGTLFGSLVAFVVGALGALFILTAAPASATAPSKP
jgi:hypothetical protein